jgi:hypothetical protein
VWGLTDSGRKRLTAIRRAGTLERLPESPQHRVWREARTEAAERIGNFREQLRDTLNRATRMLDARDETESDTWRDLGEQLMYGCRRLASATYCLREWAEPDDANADTAEAGHGERRNIRLWDRR